MLNKLEVINGINNKYIERNLKIIWFQSIILSQQMIKVKVEELILFKKVDSKTFEVDLRDITNRIYKI